MSNLLKTNYLLSEPENKPALKPYYSHAGITIYHGDCREILPLLSVSDLMLTDPPYGIGFAAQPTNYQRAAGMKSCSWDDSPVDELLDVLAWGEIQVVWGGNYYNLPISRGWLAWCKPDAPPSMGTLELAWTNQDRNSKFFFHSIAATNAERLGHPTQKPFRLMQWCIQQFPDAGTICDPFCGSGTTLAAAKWWGKQAIGIEIEEKYCEIAAKRLSQEVFDFSGGQP